MSIAGSFTLADPLISEVTFTNVYPTALDFSFSNGHDTLGPADVNPARTQFQIQTDAVGNITHWLVQLVTPVSVGASAASAFTSNQFNFFMDDGQFLVECTSLASPGLCETSIGFSEASNFESQGTWTITTSNTPLPAALPLFATGFGAIGLLGWRRKKKAQVATDKRRAA
jgi:hypothetical protein